MIDKLLSRLPDISLEEMKDVKLMNRIDTKYLVSIGQLCKVLECCADDYYAQMVAGKKMATYDTVYLDSMDMAMYTAHETQRLVREKIRMRTYTDTNETFLEIKRKNNHGRTMKKRIKIRGSNYRSHEAREFLTQRSSFTSDKLLPMLETHFDRITLVNHAKTERLTIDINLQFRNLKNSNVATCRDMAIIELKRDGLTPSPMKDLLMRQHIHTCGFSKYCIGCALTDSTLRQNNLKQKLRTLPIYKN